MAKNKKGVAWKKSAGQKKADIREKDYNFKFYADEFEKLLGKEYKILLDNGKVVKLSFDKGNFYHLLGFHKFENVVFYSMINDDTINYSPQDFFDDVFNERIWYSGFDHNEIIIPEKFSESTFADSFKDHELTDKTRHTLEERFPFFSYDDIVQIFENKKVVKFERGESEYSVRATKILFHFISERNRNLDIFIDEDNDDNCFVTSFYLESRKNMYMYKKDGSQMDIFHVLALYIEECNNHQSVKFSVDWTMIRNIVGNGYDTYNRMKRLLKKGAVCTRSLKDNLGDIIKRKEEILLEVGRLENEETILNLENEYNIASEDNKDKYALKLMEYEIDVESLLLDQDDFKRKSNKIRREIKDKKKLIKTLENKAEEVSLGLCEIEKLDKSVLKQVYCPLIERSQFWKEEFWDYFIHNFDYLRENITPKQLRNEYKKWREGVLK